VQIGAPFGRPVPALPAQERAFQTGGSGVQSGAFGKGVWTPFPKAPDCTPEPPVWRPTTEGVGTVRLRLPAQAAVASYGGLRWEPQPDRTNPLLSWGWKRPFPAPRNRPADPGLPVGFVGSGKGRFQAHETDRQTMVCRSVSWAAKRRPGTSNGLARRTELACDWERFQA